MFGRKKKEINTGSYTVDFSDKTQSVNNTDTVLESYFNDPVEEDGPQEDFNPIDKLYYFLSDLMDVYEDWSVSESGIDNEGYTNYTVIHRTKPITVNFNSYNNENEATVLISGEDVENIIGYDMTADLADKIYDIINEVEERLEEEREVRNNESAQRILDMLGYGED
ncbi:MAG: hypothetical protein M0R77_18395 [Gammaproteobacteria bacterium]|nr:hypothetical protein [Gammaproteobacteria bacterium]